MTAHVALMLFATDEYRVAQKVSHYQMIKKSYYIVLKPVNEIRFLRQIKV